MTSRRFQIWFAAERICDPSIFRQSLAGLLLLSVLCAGCRSTPKLGLNQPGAPHYKRALVVYEIDGLQRPLPLSASEITPVGFQADPDRDPSRSSSHWATATLSIQYPHPDGNPEMARAVLRLSSKPPAARDSNSESDGTPDDEVWVLDFPRSELDVLVTDLSGSGFFEKQTRNGAGTYLDIRLDRIHAQKEWTPEPRLDTFIGRVYCEGKLGGLVPCNSCKIFGGSRARDAKPAQR